MKRGNPDQNCSFLAHVAVDGDDNIISMKLIDESVSIEDDTQMRIEFELTPQETVEVVDLLIGYWSNHSKRKLWKSSTILHTSQEDHAINHDMLDVVSELGVDAVLEEVDPKCRKPFVQPTQTIKPELAGSALSSPFPSIPALKKRPVAEDYYKESSPFQSADRGQNASNPENSEKRIKHSGKIDCCYGKDNLKCTNKAKKKYGYCGHHLRIISKKYQRQKDFKTSRSSLGLIDSSTTIGEDPVDYSSLM